MIKVSEEAVEVVSLELIKAKYNLNELFKRIEEENPRIAEYIQCQANKSKSHMEIIGTGTVVYMLLAEEFKLRRNKALCGFAGADDGHNFNLQELLEEDEE